VPYGFCRHLPAYGEGGDGEGRRAPTPIESGSHAAPPDGLLNLRLAPAASRIWSSTDGTYMPADVAPGVRSPLRRTADRQASEFPDMTGAARCDRRPRTGLAMAQRIPLPARLDLLVAGMILLLILFAAGLIYIDHVHKRDAAYDRVLENVRTIQLAPPSRARR